MNPQLTGIDHVHVFVPDRDAAANWFQEVLGFHIVESLRFWADEHGPLTIEDASGKVHLALFARDVETPSSAIAFGCSGAEFLRWKVHLEERDIPTRWSDHTVSWSLYFQDPYENSYEIASNDYDEVAAAIQEQLTPGTVSE
jgi:catechol-2,3-dioxygenase